MQFARLAFLPFILASIITYGQSPAASDGSSAAQTAFASLQSLAGSWQGSVTSDNPAFSTNKPVPLSIHVASHGNALVHELDTGGPEVTVFYIQDGHLNLVHYCDLGNRPHMTAKPMVDGKSVEFDLTEFSGSDQIGHVSQGVFTIIDPDHHVEDWTFVPAGSKPVHVHMDFRRVR